MLGKKNFHQSKLGENKIRNKGDNSKKTRKSHTTHQELVQGGGFGGGMPPSEGEEHSKTRIVNQKKGCAGLAFYEPPEKKR